MPTTEEFVRVLVDREAGDAEDSLDTLVEFVAENWLTDEAVAGICAWIDEQHFADEFAEFLQQRGLGVDVD